MVGVELDGAGVIVESVAGGVVVFMSGLVDWSVVSGAVVVGSVWPCCCVVLGCCGLNDGSGVVLGCVVGSGARVEGAILWDAVTVGPNAALQDCIVGSHVEIGAGAQLGVTAVVEGRTAVPANARL